MDDSIFYAAGIFTSIILAFIFIRASRHAKQQQDTESFR